MLCARLFLFIECAQHFTQKSLNLSLHNLAIFHELLPIYMFLQTF